MSARTLCPSLALAFGAAVFPGAAAVFPGAAAAQSPGASTPAPASGAGDAAAGGMSFMQCADCHSTTNSAGAGPGLRGVVGRRAGSGADFPYSAAMAKSTLVWDAKSLDAFLAHPKAVVPGTTMDFPGIGDAADRANLVAYLATLK